MRAEVGEADCGELALVRDALGDLIDAMHDEWDVRYAVNNTPHVLAHIQRACEALGEPWVRSYVEDGWL